VPNAVCGACLTFAGQAGQAGQTGRSAGRRDRPQRGLSADVGWREGGTVGIRSTNGRCGEIRQADAVRKDS
jgi:hypothetical protein